MTKEFPHAHQGGRRRVDHCIISPSKQSFSHFKAVKAAELFNVPSQLLQQHNITIYANEPICFDI